MITSPLLGLRPILSSLITTRYVRPCIKLSKDKFQISIDVREFKMDELRVKARPEYVVIEGKQERKMKNGFIIRQFYRKFKLPDGCNPSNIETNISNDGVLTITAPRTVCEQNMPCETTIPIKSCSNDTSNPSFVNVSDNVPGDTKADKKPSGPPGESGPPSGDDKKT